MDTIGLSEQEIDLLREVGGERVSFVRGAYLHPIRKADVSTQIQRLRAMGLVRLYQTPPGQRFAPTRRAELTDKGELVLAGYTS